VGGPDVAENRAEVQARVGGHDLSQLARASRRSDVANEPIAIALVALNARIRHPDPGAVGASLVQACQERVEKVATPSRAVVVVSDEPREACPQYER
jgi:hypothetical protein